MEQTGQNENDIHKMYILIKLHTFVNVARIFQVEQELKIGKQLLPHTSLPYHL